MKGMMEMSNLFDSRLLEDIKWVPTTVHKVAAQIKFEYGSIDRDEFIRDSLAHPSLFYRSADSEWPVLYIYLIKNWNNSGYVKLDSNLKYDANSWFVDCGIPKSVLPDVIKMLESVV